MWNEANRYGVKVANWSNYTEKTHYEDGKYKVWKLEYTTDYDKALSVKINDDDWLVLETNETIFLDLMYDVAMVKFDNAKKPDTLD